MLGFFVGMVVAGGVYFCAARFVGASMTVALNVGVPAALIGAGYSANAFSKLVYAASPLSVLGYLLDMSWSLLNTAAGFLVWIPACKITKAGFVAPDPDSKRSGTFVYANNPRGGGYTATTIGTIIAGGWTSHEETHVWQARILGPAYLITYGTAWALNVPFRLITGKAKDIGVEAYYRIPFEDWAYWGGSTSGPEFNWNRWLIGLALALIYTAALMSIPLGIMLGLFPLWLTGVLVLVSYSLIRAFTPAGN